MNESPSVVCFGECLWDIFPSGNKVAGGAPMNVAYHLNKLGVQAKFVSRVGNDPNGTELLNKMRLLSIPTDYVQIEERFPTGEVFAKMDDHQQMSYDIAQHVAWDYIHINDDIKQLVAQSKAFVFGSLSARWMISRQTLMGLLEVAPYKVFDINLRDPYYSKQLVFTLLEKTDLLNLNNYELMILASWINTLGRSDSETIAVIQRKFRVNEIIVTEGARGATYYKGKEVYKQLAFPVEVADTVGSGDSFMAGFLSKKLSEDTTLESQMKFATALAGLVASRPGGCPEYKIEEIDRMMKD